MIDTSQATYIESLDGTYHSYTFAIYRNTENEQLENILLSLQADGTYRALLVTYNLTKQEQKDLEDGKSVDLENQVHMEDLDSRFSNYCITGHSNHWTCAAGNNHSPADVATGDCVQTSFTVTTEASWGFCPPGGGTSQTNTGTHGEPGTQTNPNSGTNHGENSGEPNNNTDVTTPISISNAEKIEIFMQLNAEQAFWANRQSDETIKDIVDYLFINCAADYTSTGCQEAEAFVVAAISATEDATLNWDDIIFVIENEQDYRNQMSDDELTLFDTLTTVQQIKYLASAKEAIDKTDELFLTLCERYNGKGDAFRHAYWNALSSSRIGTGLTNLLTTRHENKPPTYPYNSKENVMDLFNNQIGRNIISNGSTDILQDILDALNDGNLRYLSNQDINCRASFASQLTPTNQ